MTTAVEHQHAIQVTFADLDWQGHVNNTSHVRWLQEAHFHLLDPARNRLFWPSRDSFLVGGHSIEYVTLLRHREQPITVSTRVREIRTSRVTLESTIHDEHRVYARGCSSYVAFSLLEHKPRSLTDEERRNLGLHLS